MSSSPIDIERTNLEVHVDLCAQRYDSLDKRLSGIEEKVEEIQESIKNGHNSMVKVIIGTAGTVVAGVLSVLIVLLTNAG